MSTTAGPRKPTSVHDSNAGHDFHVLWATRRLIELLNPASTLQAVKMEGVAAEDTALLSATDDHFLAADLTEYYGGSHFAEADRTVISQLKYSTRHPDKQWTRGRIRERKGTDNSVIERLAGAYQDLLNGGHLRASIQQKVRIRLISNQPLDLKLKKLWLDTQAALQALGPNQINLTQLFGVLDTIHHDDINKLFTQIGFSEEQFTDFFRVIDFSGCGAEDRLGQRLAVLQDLAPSVPTGEKDVFLRLTELVRQQALPENQNAAPLTQDDVLVQLQVFSKKDLFPEPTAFNYPAHPVPTLEAVNIAGALQHGCNQHFIAHGAAGVGKTTTIQQIQSHLPANSITILYDCYADGNYYNLSTGRHTLENALLQLSNELAIATGLPFLVTTPSSKYKFLDYFQQRLTAAAQVVEAAGGLLVLIIDAADNSIVKAHKDPNANCFIPYLWELKLPANCRLLMTSRTHRKDSLQAPAHTVEIELSGFDETASANRLRQVFLMANQRSAAAFHRRTGGNPRVQEYWLDSGTNVPGSYAAFLHSFRRKSTTATEIIEDIVKAAIIEVQNPDRAQEQLATLVCLQRPIPIAEFAQASGLSIMQASAFCHALKPGLLLENGLIGFRDEDFETQLRVRPETVSRLHGTHERLGNHFLPLAGTNAYAAQAVAEHFSAATRYNDLIALALTGPSLAFIPDSALRLRTERRRLKLALKSAATLRNDIAGAKITILAAESLRANEAVKNLIKSDVEIATYFGDTSTVADYFQTGLDDQWLGTVHYRLAAHHAAIPAQRASAERHLAHAQAWVRGYMRKSEQERQHWRIEDLDLACEAEAYYWLEKPEIAYKQLQRWRPAEARLRALHILLGRLSAVVPIADLEGQLRQLNLPLLAQCIAQAALWRYGHIVSKEWCVEVEARLLPLLRRKKFKPVIEYWPFSEATEFIAWPLHLAELFTHQQLRTETSLLLLDDLFPAFPSHSAGNHSTYADKITPIRVACLQAYLRGKTVTGLDLFPLPPDVKEKEKSYPQRNTYEDEGYRKNLDRFISLYSCRTQLLATPILVATVEQIIRIGLENLHPNRNSSDYYYRHRQAQWLRSAISLVARVTNAEPLLEQLANQAQSLVGRYLARQLWIHIAHESLRFPHYQALAFRCLERAARDAEEDNLPVNDRWPILLECAQASLPYDEEFSRDFYRRAITAAHQGVGDDVAHRLKVAAEVAGQLGSGLTPENGYNIGKQLGALVEAYKPYVTGDDIYMPLDATLTAVTKLHPAAGAALCLRWDVININSLEDSVISLAEAATASGFWHPTQSLWLLKLCGEADDISRIALTLLDKLPTASAEQREHLAGPLSAVAAWISKDVPVPRRLEALKRILAWADAHQQLHLPAIKAIQQTANFVESTVIPTSARQNSALSEYEVERQTRAAEWDAAALRNDILAFDNWLDALPFDHEEMVPALLKLAYRVSPSQRTAVLELLIKVRVFYGSHRNVALDTLEKLLRDWRSFGPVQVWAEKGLPRFFARNIYGLTREKDWPPHLEQVCSLPLSDSSRAYLLLPGVADELDSLGPELLCRVASALTKNGETSALTEYTDWLLSRMQAQLEADEKALPFQELLPATALSVPTPAALFAQFIWSVCGHPDKRVRWRAIHAARQLLVMPDNVMLRKDILTEIMRLSFTRSSLLPENEEFYWQGARVWVLVLLDRIADELPADLLPHLAAIKQHAFDENFPHAQIRELARRILVKMHKHEPSCFSVSELEQVEFNNRPKTCLIVRGYRVEAPEIFPAIQRINQFEFDYMDTVEHWFGPLAEVFGQSKDKIVALVENWICDKWGRTTAECKAHRLHDQTRYEWGLLSHYKVDDTTVDNLKMHLTHHALMCVAGELADKFAMRVEDYSELNSTWEQWLERYLPSAGPHTWLADWRGPTPLRPECWGKLPNPWRRKPFSHYFEALGFTEPNRSGWLIIYGHHSFGENEKSGDVYVSSVQVAPEASQSLLWALHAQKSNDYVFPKFGLADTDPDESDKVPAFFALSPLLREAPNIDKGIERHDTAAHGVYTTYPLLSEDFITRCSLTEIKDGKEYYDSLGKLAAEYEIWDDELRDRHRAHNREAYSSGCRLWVRWDVLQHYLSLTGKNVLFQATLSRNISTSGNSQRKNSYDLGKRRLALLLKDGTFKTVAGNCSPWPTHSS